eukprot:UN07571
MYKFYIYNDRPACVWESESGLYPPPNNIFEMVGPPGFSSRAATLTRAPTAKLVPNLSQVSIFSYSEGPRAYGAYIDNKENEQKT